MKSLFNNTDNNEIIERINSLTPESKAGWGKMNVAQMMSHCSIALQACLGEIKPKRVFISYLFGKMVKKQVMSPKDFGKNSPTAKEYLIKDVKNFESEKEILITYVKKFEAGPDVVTKEQHPFFGKMTIEEWDCLMWKHLDHHMRQFGV
jgi:hypothetical protein